MLGKQTPAYACALPYGFWMGAELQAGIDRYAREHDREFQPFWMTNLGRLQDQTWMSGLLVFVSMPSFVGQIEHLGCPIVNLSGNLDDLPFPSVMNDARSMGDRAAAHLIECGAKRIHYLTFQRMEKGYRRQRFAGVSHRCALHGIECVKVSLLQKRELNRHHWDQRRLKACEDWLGSQQPPCAVIAANPQEAAFLSRAALQLGWTLGQELALLQLTHPREARNYGNPAISYIAHDWRGVGYCAAETLCQWVEEEIEPPSVTWVPPLPVVLTSSSDPSYASGLGIRFKSFLLHHPDLGLQVEEVAKGLGVSTSTLYREIKDLTGPSPKVHLVQRQLDEAKRLLCSTDLPIETISAQCGYRVVHSLNAAFRKNEGMTPGQWRREQTG